MSIPTLQGLIGDFAARRDWQQFHTPRNLVLALVGEVGELAAEYQWLHDHVVAQGLSAEKREAISLEIADIAIYLFRLADILGVDIADVVKKKLAMNEDRSWNPGD